jgi:hypothetical protein
VAASGAIAISKLSTRSLAFTVRLGGPVDFFAMETSRFRREVGTKGHVHARAFDIDPVRSLAEFVREFARISKCPTFPAYGVDVRWVP